MLAALVATAIGVVVGLPALRLSGLSLGVVTLALAYAIEAVWFRNADIVPSRGPHLVPVAVRDRPRHRVGQGLPKDRVRPDLPGHAGSGGRERGRAAAQHARVRHAGRPRQRALGRRRRGERGAGEGAQPLASFIAGLGGSLLAYRRGVVTFDSFTAIGGLALLSTAYLAGITSVWGGINAGILAASGITFIALDRWVNLGEWFQVISGVLLIVTLITNPEGMRRRATRSPTAGPDGRRAGERAKWWPSARRWRPSRLRPWWRQTATGAPCRSTTSPCATAASSP